MCPPLPVKLAVLAEVTLMRTDCLLRRGPDVNKKGDATINIFLPPIAATRTHHTRNMPSANMHCRNARPPLG